MPDETPTIPENPTPLPTDGTTLPDDDRVSAWEIDKKGLLLGQMGQPLLDYQYIIRKIKSFKSYKKIPTKHSPHKGTHTVLRSELNAVNGETLKRLDEYHKEVQALHDQIRRFAES